MEGPKITEVEGNNNNENSNNDSHDKLGEDFTMLIDWVELALELQFPLSGPQCTNCAVTISPPRDALAQALMKGVDFFWSWKAGTKGIENYEAWKIDLWKLNVGTPFEIGKCGKLFEGRYKGEDVAIKILERPEICCESRLNMEQRAHVASKILEREQLMEQQVYQEVMMLASLKHPNIVRFIGACRNPKVWCIVTEYPEGGSVRQRNGSVPLKLAVKQALDVAKGMEYAHGLGFIHRDLKSDNLLIFKDKSIKIAGFGVARIKEQTPETGMYRWMAPEMIQDRPCTNKVDVYSFGIVLWELITGMLPFHNIGASDVVNNGVRPIIPNDCLPSLNEIMTRCWDADPEVRPPFTHVVKMLQNAETEIRVHNPRFRW